MKLAREETKNEVNGRSFYCKNNLKFKDENRSWNREKNCLNPNPEPRQNGMVPQRWL
jgi:hypothetical protein